MQPKMCDMNANKDGTTKNLTDEPGITELMTLYLDDNYDYSNGTFTGMSDETKKQFQKDLKTFYTTFTGNDIMPPEITKFSDIKLKDYGKHKYCQGNAPLFKNKYTINKKSDLFVEYAKNTQLMIQTAAKNQSKLLDVINELFTYVIDPYTKKQKIRVNPKLTEETLQKSVEKTRKLIIELYVDCELSYVKGMKLYEAIVESKILETTQKQIDTLEKKTKELITAPDEPVVPKMVVKPGFTKYPEKPELNAVKPEFNPSTPKYPVKPELNALKPELNAVKPELNAVKPELNEVKPEFNPSTPKYPVKPEYLENSFNPVKPEYLENSFNPAKPEYLENSFNPAKPELNATTPKYAENSFNPNFVGVQKNTLPPAAIPKQNINYNTQDDTF